MTEGLLALLGFDEDDPRVAAAREDAQALSNLVETLVLARHDCGLTQKAVALEMETTQSTISNFERIGGDPKFSTLLRYARAIGARIRFVVTFGQESNTSTRPNRVPARATRAELGSYSGFIYVAANRDIQVAVNEG